LQIVLDVKWMENLKEQSQVHPAEVLAKALDRANGLLGTIGQFFDADGEIFAGGNSFVAHAISASTAFVTEAQVALEDLHLNCDLTLLSHPEDRDTVIEMNFSLPVSGDSQMSGFAEETLEQDFIATAAAEPDTKLQQHSFTEIPKEEQLAKSYLELLRKLTAAEVFASEQQALSVPGASTELLPLLRSLREDLQKIHSAA
jgi:hypothetical protein